MSESEVIVWLDGRLLPWRAGQSHYLSHGHNFGCTVFDSMRAYDGRIFKLAEHVGRLMGGARQLGMSVPWTQDQVADACEQVVRINGLTNAYLRPAIWCGEEGLGLSMRRSTVHLAIAGWNLGHYYASAANSPGIRLEIASWRCPHPQSVPTQVKLSGLYPGRVLAKQHAEDSGFDDALLLDHRGFIAEATGANIFLVIAGELHTPIADCFLNGITRQAVMNIAVAQGLKVIERHIAPEEITIASEAFLTGTAAEITRVREIAGTELPGNHVCRLLAAEYVRLARSGG